MYQHTCVDRGVLQSILVAKAAEVIKAECKPDELVLLWCPDNNTWPLAYALQDELVYGGMDRFQVTIVVANGTGYTQAWDKATLVIQVVPVDGLGINLNISKSRHSARRERRIGLNIEAVEMA
jgi:hypothetical protein